VTSCIWICHYQSFGEFPIPIFRVDSLEIEAENSSKKSKHYQTSQLDISEHANIQSSRKNHQFLTPLCLFASIVTKYLKNRNEKLFLSAEMTQFIFKTLEMKRAICYCSV
jgi:hypothetical protein